MPACSPHISMPLAKPDCQLGDPILIFSCCWFFIRAIPTPLSLPVTMLSVIEELLNTHSQNWSHICAIIKLPFSSLMVLTRSHFALLIEYMTDFFPSLD